MALLMHLAPRTLCVNPIMILSGVWSILAGCVIFVDFVKIVLARLSDRITCPYSTTPIQTWVDDIVLIWMGCELSPTAKKLIDMLDALVDGLEDLGFTISDKSIMLASRAEVVLPTVLET